jgi:hypothetical protein
MRVCQTFAAAVRGVPQAEKFEGSGWPLSAAPMCSLDYALAVRVPLP